MEFVKMQGLGNDFIVIVGPFTPRPEDVERWCARRTGVGADGVLVVEARSDDRVAMRYWNADGGEAEMCGNGLRCIARFAVDRKMVASNNFVVETKAGDLPVEVHDDGTVRALVGVAHSHRTLDLTVAGTKVYPVGLGNPHAVIFVDDQETAPVSTLGPRIEKDPIFPTGTNVEFVTVDGDDVISVRTWERGIGETLACGTGAAASALLAHRTGATGAELTVRLRGGDLKMSVTDSGIWMDGPAEYAFSGVLS